MGVADGVGCMVPDGLGWNGDMNRYTRWWFQIFFIFTTIWGRFPILTVAYFSKGWFNHQPDWQLNASPMIIGHGKYVGYPHINNWVNFGI